MSRKSICSCGQLSAEVVGEAATVAICFCQECQRRTGSIFGYSGYWDDANVMIKGVSKSWSRISDAGRWLEFHFCETCGSTIWWRSEFQPKRIGLALGNMEQTGLAPAAAVWTSRRVDWIDRIDELECFAEGRV